MEVYYSDKFSDNFLNFLKYKENLDWYHLSRNSNISLRLLTENKDKDWNIRGLSYNKNITFTFINSNLDL